MTSRITTTIVMMLSLALAGSVVALRLWKAQDLALDFPAFYLAGHVPFRSLYDPATFHSLGQRLLASQGVHYYPPYVRPAVFAPPLHILAVMSFHGAFWAWLSLQYACYVCSLVLVFRFFRPGIYALLGFAVFHPALFGPTWGQDTSVVALILVLGLALLLARRDVAAGIALAFGLYKFNLIGLLPLVLLAQSRYRALAAFCACGGLLVIASVLLSSPAQYVWLLTHVRDVTGVAPGSFGIRGLLTDAGLGWYYPPLAIFIVFLTYIAATVFSIKESFAVTVLACYLCASPVAWYDAVILLIPLAAAFARGTSEMVVGAAVALTVSFSERALVVTLLVLYCLFVFPALKSAAETRLERRALYKGRRLEGSEA